MLPPKVKYTLYAAAAITGVIYHDRVAEPLTTIGALVLTAAMIGLMWRPLSFATRFLMPAAIATLLGIGLGMIPDLSHGGNIQTLPPLIDPTDEAKHRLLIVPVLAFSLALLLGTAAWWLAQALRVFAKPAIYPRATHPLVVGALVAQGQWDGYRAIRVAHEVLVASPVVPSAPAAPPAAPTIPTTPSSISPAPSIAPPEAAPTRTAIDVSSDRDQIIECWLGLLEAASIAYWLRHADSGQAKRTVLVDAHREEDARNLLNSARK